MGWYDLRMVRVGFDYNVDIRYDYRGDIRKYFREPRVLRWTQEDLK